MGMSKKIDRHRLHGQNKIQMTSRNFFYVQDTYSKTHFLQEFFACLNAVK